MDALRRSIGAVAPLESTVLVTGETGVGKGLVARALHAASGRSAGRPVARSTWEAQLVWTYASAESRLESTDTRASHSQLGSPSCGGALRSVAGSLRA